MTVMGYALIGVGLAGFVLAHVAEQWHKQRFEAVASDEDTIDEEIRRFHGDKRVDYAIHAMAIGHMGGTLLIMGGALLLLAK